MPVLSAKFGRSTADDFTDDKECFLLQEHEQHSNSDTADKRQGYIRAKRQHGVDFRQRNMLGQHKLQVQQASAAGKPRAHINRWVSPRTLE